MKNGIVTVFMFMLAFVLMSNSSCEARPQKKSSDQEVQQRTEQAMKEANRQLGMPSISRYQEKRNLKWIYELCDQEEFLCHAYLVNSYNGTVGQYLGRCIGYGIPYSTQYSNPQKVSKIRCDFGQYHGEAAYTIEQPEPNGLFKPVGLSATWLIMINPETKKPTPVYLEPEIIVSPFKLH